MCKSLLYRITFLGLALALPPVAQPVFTDVFPPDEYAARRAKVMAKIGDAVAIIQGTTERPDEMRGTKSPREIAILREATRIAGLGIIEAMRDARPGMKEYELQADAEYVFKKYGAYGPAYFALIATGQNTWYSHYHKNTRTLDAGDLVQVRLRAGFQVLLERRDARLPGRRQVHARQREFYTIYLRLYQALMTSIQVHMRPSDVIKMAVVKMDAVMKATDSRRKIKQAATQFVDRYRNSRSNSLGHNVGMEVHDVRSPTATLEPGQVFTIEPAMQLPESTWAYAWKI